MTPRILVTSASVGAGHIRAAQAIELALKELAPEAHIENVDVLTLTGPVFRRLYAKAYLDLVNRAPHLLGYIYDLTDKARKPARGGDRLRALAQKLNLQKIIDLLDASRWDLVVNAHFLPAEIIATRARRRRRVPRQVTVVTDFDAHAFWVNQPCERYFVATEEAALALAHWGVPRATIEVTGIPIHPVFAREKPRAECVTKHELSDARPVVLLLAGGFGVGPIESLFRGVLDVERPLQVVVVAGKNESLRTKLARIGVPERHAAKVMGFTTEIDELMRAADIVVTKPGGLTTSEILACGAVMVIANPIPGQESRNSDFLLEHGAAIKVNSAAVLSRKLSLLLADQERLARLKAAARSLGKPRAAYEIASRVLQTATSGSGTRA